MTLELPNFERLIKKHLYGRTQQALLIVPPGFGAAVKKEVLHILKTSVQVHPLQDVVLSETEGGHLKIENADLTFLIELLLRMRTASDLRLLLHKGRAAGYGALKRECSQVKLALYFAPPSRVPLRVDAQASQVFIEREMAAVLETEFAKQGVTVTSSLTGALPQNDLGAILHARLFRDILTLEVSLAGRPLAHRGYKESLVAIAPLREDLAACVLASVCSKLAEWHNTPEYEPPQGCYVPFAGSGTFLFESYMLWNDIPPFLFREKYGLEQLHFFKEATFLNLKKRVLSREVDRSQQYASTAFVALEKSSDQFEALQINWRLFSQKMTAAGARPTSCELKEGDFFAPLGEPNTLRGRVFVPLNPPYGLRLNAQGHGTGDADFYAEIARQLLALKKQSSGAISVLEGCILCATEQQWRAFLKELPTGAQNHTSHFTQGGIDVRLVTFLF